MDSLYLLIIFFYLYIKYLIFKAFVACVRDARIYIRGQIFCGYPQFPTDTDRIRISDLTEGDFLLN